MKPEWLDFLTNAGAEITDYTVNSFGNPERERQVTKTGLIICDLSHLGLISVYGDDAATFLQGQLTNDIRDVSLQHSQLSAYCTPKGRMLSNFRIFKREDTYYLRLPREQLETSLKRIHMFVLMSKATLEDSSDALVHIGVSGQNAEEHLAGMIPDLPKNIDDVTQCKGYTVIRLAGPHARFEIYGELEPMQALWNHLDVHAAPVGAGPWEMLDILAGTPTIYPATAEAFVPQMANMQLVNGVNFQKGCYTGQEVVARMQYLGKLKRRMFLVHIDTNETINPGDGLFSADSTSGQGTGTIVSAQPNPDGGAIALAVINISDAEAGQIKLVDANGPIVQIKELPYAFESSAD
ncbi:MAG: folate-binding protein YgfZ [Gammaproteobacteria bacterium]|nr:folate-binding protein YgfZ [Gammaproteobacteria bacterium]